MITNVHVNGTCRVKNEKKTKDTFNFNIQNW